MSLTTNQTVKLTDVAGPIPCVAVTADVKFIDIYRCQLTPEQYVKAALEASHVTPFILPSFGDQLDLDAALDRVDGVMITGAKSNVHPSLYGKQPHEKYEPYDPDRDATTLPLIRRAIERGIPLLAICRGIQELNVALGGTLETEIQEKEGSLDHRVNPNTDDNNERFKIWQDVKVAEGSCLADVLGAGTVKVNSLHRQGIETLGNGLQVEAVADDGTIEAVSVKNAKGFAVGVQWHPEYWATSDAPSRKIFEAFGNATREYLASKSGLSEAAE